MARIIAQYESRDIFNADKTALFYRIQTAQTFAMPGEKVYGQKIEKSRVTILVAASAEGEKLPLLCIGRVNLSRWPVVMGKRHETTKIIYSWHPSASPPKSEILAKFFLGYCLFIYVVTIT